MGIPISKSTYAKLETNRMNIKVSELLALAQIFHCDVGEFFKIFYNPSVYSSYRLFSLSPFRAVLLQYFFHYHQN